MLELHFLHYCTRRFYHYLLCSFFPSNSCLFYFRTEFNEDSTLFLLITYHCSLLSFEVDILYTTLLFKYEYEALHSYSTTCVCLTFIPHCKRTQLERLYDVENCFRIIPKDGRSYISFTAPFRPLVFCTLSVYSITFTNSTQISTNTRILFIISP